MHQFVRSVVTEILIFVIIWWMWKTTVTEDRKYSEHNWLQELESFDNVGVSAILISGLNNFGFLPTLII